MARITKNSKRVAFSIAFLAVMAGSGAMIGGVAGVVLALLGTTVLHTNSGIVEFIYASVLTGAAVTFLLGLYLSVRQLAPVSRRAVAAGSAQVAPASRAVVGSESK